MVQRTNVERPVVHCRWPSPHLGAPLLTSYCFFCSMAFGLLAQSSRDNLWKFSLLFYLKALSSVGSWLSLWSSLPEENTEVKILLIF